MEKQTPNPENKVEAKLEGNTHWKLPVILMSKNKTLKYDHGVGGKISKRQKKISPKGDKSQPARGNLFET